MGNTIKSIIKGTGNLLDITGIQGLQELLDRRNNVRSGIKKHTRGIKRHFDRAYSQLK